MARRYWKRLPVSVISILLVASVTAWFLAKPVRLVSPETLGYRCVDGVLCVEDEADLEKARKLRAEAIQNVSDKLGAFRKPPRIVFCATWDCAARFGLGERSAVSFGTFGSAISPRAWKDYYLRHELIHQLQAQNLGTLKCLLLPSWLLEGMAYSLSGDPRVPLPQPWEGYRARFNTWFASIGKDAMWQEAAISF